MTMQELLIQAINITSQFNNVYNCEIDERGNQIDISLRDVKTSKRWCISFSLELEKTIYKKHISMVFCFRDYNEKVTDLEYTQEELQKYIERFKR